MKVLLHMITTPNGYIARDNSQSVSTADDWQDFAESVKQCNNFVVGRKTLELVGEEGFAKSECDYKVVVSSRKNLQLDPSFTVVHSPQAAIEFLQDKVGTLFLVGGSELNTAFARAGLIDEVVLIVQPTIIGKGVRLFDPDEFELSLIAKNVEQLPAGRIKITYLAERL